MYKLLFLSALVFSGCSYFTFNATMCEQIASDPQATIPQECRAYNEEEAKKAFDKEKQNISTDEIIKFNKE